MMYPIYGTPLVSFQKKIDEFHDHKKHGPMVVHGSAGVGRPGTFITLDAQLQKIKYEGTLDIFQFCAISPLLQELHDPNSGNSVVCLFNLHHYYYHPLLQTQ